MDFVKLNYGGFGKDTLESLYETYNTRQCNKYLSEVLADHSSKIYFDFENHCAHCYIAWANVVVSLSEHKHDLPEQHPLYNIGPDKNDDLVALSSWDKNEEYITKAFNKYEKENQAVLKLSKSKVLSDKKQLNTVKLNKPQKIHCSCQANSTCEHIDYARFLLFVKTHDLSQINLDLLISPQLYDEFIKELKEQINNLFAIGLSSINTEHHNIIKGLYLKASALKLQSFENLLQSVILSIDLFLNEQQFISINFFNTLTRIINLIDALEVCTNTYEKLTLLSNMAKSENEEELTEENKEQKEKAQADYLKGQDQLQKKYISLLEKKQDNNGVFASIYLIGIGYKKVDIVDPTSNIKRLIKFYCYSPEYKKFFYFNYAEGSYFSSSWTLFNSYINLDSISKMIFKACNVEYTEQKLKNSEESWICDFQYNNRIALDAIAYANFKDYFKQVIENKESYFDKVNEKLSLIRVASLEKTFNEESSFEHIYKRKLLFKDLNGDYLLCFETAKLSKITKKQSIDYILVENKFISGYLVSFLLCTVSLEDLEKTRDSALSLVILDRCKHLNKDPEYAEGVLKTLLENEELRTKEMFQKIQENKELYFA